MSNKIRWGILGCGKIANKFAADLSLVQDAELAAVATRNPAAATDFISKHKPRHVFDSYGALAQCDDVDIIYIATPHGFHHEHTLLCLEHKKAVLCEKAFALNIRQVKEMIATAQRHQVFLMEAFWTKFLPQFQKVSEIISQGQIGTLKLIQADFGFRAPEPLAQRLYDPALGGGSLLDIGIYPVFLAQCFLGKPMEIHATITPYNTGVDEQCAMTLKYQHGALAVLSSTFAADTPVEAVIVGTEGRIHMRNRFHNAISTLELVIGRQEPVPVPVHRESGYGYQFEARHAGECLRKGLCESPVMSHADSLLLMETLDAIRKKCGIVYPVD